MRNVLTLASCLAASAVALLAPRPAQAADFARSGNVSVAIERTFGIHYVNTTVDPPGPVGSDSNGSTSVGFGWQPFSTPLHQPRAALDVFVIDKLSVGGSLAFFTQTGDYDGDGVLFSPRVGYAIQLSDVFTFWPRGGLTFVKVGDSSLFGITGEAMFLARPSPKWGVLFGATLDIDPIGSQPWGGGPGGDDADVSQFSVAIPTVGLLGSF